MNAERQPASGPIHRCDECGGSGTWPYRKGETPRPFHYRECSQATPPRRTLWDATCWRTGRKVGRTIYAQLDAEPSDDDPLIGVMDTPELAALVVEAVTRWQRAIEVILIAAWVVTAIVALYGAWFW